ncbi:MAG TPA: gliding motility-associated C-terminal domain-containing protein [Crocinitomicaceae bacterium]|nr:gliding motility-associated C-terminal domain-containing protein [Crocinitomicaceae bacterium]
MLLCLSTSCGFSQNLISNPSFEDIDSCYGQPAPIGFDVFAWTGCKGWSCPTRASSDLWCKNPVYGNQEPPFLPGIGYQFPHTGNNFAGFGIFDRNTQNYREYIQNRLITPLESNQYYQFSMYVSANEDSINYSSCMQAYFSNTPVNSSNYYVLPFIPQWKNETDNFITDTVGWQLVSGIFKAIGGEQYVTIGCFDDSTNVIMLDKDPSTSSDLYYFIDDVSVVKAPIQLTFPNVFTPNNNNINDVFLPIVIGIPDFKVFIYNRWGNKMITLDVDTPEWNGKGATEGVYYYVLESKATKIREQGFFHLIR